MSGRRPSASAGADGDLECDAALLGHDQRRLQGELLDRSQPASSPARSGQLDERGAGQQHRTRDRVVGQPRCVRSDSRPVSRCPSPSARATAAPSSG